MAKDVKKKKISGDNEILKLIRMILIVTLIFALFYILTIFINKEEDEQPNNDTKAEIQYDKILVADILSQSHDEYYVLAYDTDDQYYSVYEIYLSKYESKDDALRVYFAEINNPFNQNFVSEEAKLNVKEINDLKISETTLFRIKKGKISKYYIGEEIKELLSEISKTEKEEE